MNTKTLICCDCHVLAERLLDAIEEAERTLNPTNPRGSFLTDDEQKRSAWESLVRALRSTDRGA